MIDRDPAERREAAVPPRLATECPECGGGLAHESGCVVCRTCGHTACG